MSRRAEDCRRGHRNRDREGTVCVSLWPERAQQPSRVPEGLLGLFSLSLSLSLAFYLSPFARLRPKFHMSMRDRDREGEEEREAQHSFIRPVAVCRCNKGAIEGGPALKVEVYV